MQYLMKRKDTFTYKRRIPHQYKEYCEGKEFIQVSLKTSSEALAIQRADVLNKELELFWSKLEVGAVQDADIDYYRLVRIAQHYDFTYRTVGELADGGLDKIINRMQVFHTEPEMIKQPDQVKALLGGEPEPGYPISRALEHYFEFEQPNLTRKTADQLRKWKNPKIKAISNFINICGDLSINEITRHDILNLRSWWQERVETEGLRSSTPNKDFCHLKTLLYFARDHWKLDISVEELFSRVRFKTKDYTRPPFQVKFIHDELLNPNRLAGLDRECQLLLYAMADLGARPSELVGLNVEAGHIRLDTEIPFIHIQEEADREIKTVHSNRQLPLVGVSLYAFQQLGTGFKHYYRKPDHLSANINKYLRNNGLLPTDSHSLYSLRHSFEDRLTAVEPPEKLQAALMGHRYQRQRYGDGPTLEQKHSWLQKIAFDVDQILR